MRQDPTELTGLILLEKTLELEAENPRHGTMGT